MLGFPSASNSKESACSAADLGCSLGWAGPPEKGMATILVFLPGESHGQRSLVGYSPWGCKESGMTEQLTLSLTHLSPLMPSTEPGIHSWSSRSILYIELNNLI